MNKKFVLVIFLPLLAIFLFLLFRLSQKNDKVDFVPSPSPIATQTPAQFSATDITVGTGESVKAGDKIVVNYKGTLLDGTVFDSSYDRGTPFSFTLGAGEVIEGWDKGFDGMKIGGKRKLVIPPQMGYGAQAVGSIPANSTLIFEVELLEVVK